MGFLQKLFGKAAEPAVETLQEGGVLLKAKYVSPIQERDSEACKTIFSRA